MNDMNKDIRQGKENMKKDSIIDLKDGDIFEGNVKILRKIKPGPVVLVVSDGYASVDAVTRDTNFKDGDVVFLKGRCSLRSGKLQLEIEVLRSSDVDFDSIIDQKSKIVDRELSIDSEKLNILKPYLVKIATTIRKAIINNQPILIRHHADADGITSGLAIEKACKMLMAEIGINEQYNMYRSPSKAPFYEITDMLKDISLTKRIEGFDQQKPLILVLDNGSTPEDVFAMKTLNVLGFEIVVIDHHNPVVLEGKKTAVCPYVTHHVNPYMEGFDGNLSAGMLCYEVARLIYPSFEDPSLPAVSAIGDRSDIVEKDRYIEKSGLDEDKIRKLVIAIDFLAYQLRFDPGKGIYEEAFRNEKFVNILNEEVTKGVETQLQSTLPYLRTITINGVIFSYIDLEKYTLRFTYPTPGKIIGMIHDEVAKGNEGVPVITIGHLSDMVILRATRPILPIGDIIESLRKKIPEANVDGGGHECAGTIKFVSAHLTSIIEMIKDMIKNLEWKTEEEDVSS